MNCEIQVVKSKKKSNAQKCKEYRERKKIEHVKVPENSVQNFDQSCKKSELQETKKPKSDIQRSKEYRERQKIKKHIEGKQKNTDHLQRTSTKTHAEYMKEYRRRVKLKNQLRIQLNALLTKDDSDALLSNQFDITRAVNESTMNGEVNGAIEEPMDTSSPPESPENSSVVKKNATDTNNECEAMEVNENSNHTVNSTQPDSIADSEFSNGGTDTSTIVSSTTVEESSKPSENSEVNDDITQSSGYTSQTAEGISPIFDVAQSAEPVTQSSGVMTKVNDDVIKSTNNADNGPENRDEGAENAEIKSNDITVATDVCKHKDPITNVPDQECTNSNESSAASTESSGIKLQDDVDMISEINDVEPEEAGESDREKQTVSTNDDSDEDDSEEDSSEDGTEDGTDGTDDGDVVKIGDGDEPVSIPSESEVDLHDQGSLDDSSKKGDNSDCMEMVDLSKRSDDTSDGNNGNNGTSPEVQEILSDDPEECSVVTVDPHGKLSDVTTKSSDTPIRRSSRVVKRKSYIDQENGNGESDVEEIVDDPLNHKLVQKNKSIVVNDTQKLVDMASKSIKTGTVTITQKKEPTVVIIDTNSILSGKANLPTHQSKTSSYTSMQTSAAAAQSLYQSIAARGTTVTPVSSKVAQSTNIHIPHQAQPTPAPILPSLTDDMFVVEAPSFIVPYVYEKPSVKPFRGFVDTLGKELEIQKAKDEQARLLKQKEKEESVKKEKPEEEDEKVKSENPKMDESEGKSQENEDTPEAATKKKDKKGRKKGNDDDDNSWTGNSSSDSDDDISEDEATKTVIIKEKEDDVLETIKDTTNVVEPPPEPKIPGIKSDSYFDNSLGKFFITIGVNLVQEYVQTDLLKQQKRKLQKENRSGGNTRGTESAIHSLLKNIEFSKENNAPYRFEAKKCEFCSFKTESALALAHHMETPHMKNNIYKCNFCPFEIRSPHDILYHMEAEHNIRGRLERAPAYHQCANCPFEDNGKGKLARHLIACAKKFKPEQNLAPPLEWEPPAKIPKMARGRNTLMGSYQAAFGRLGATTAVNSPLTRPPVGVQNIPAAAMQNFRAQNRGRPQAPPSLPRSTSVHAAPIVRGGVVLRPTTPQVLLPANYHMLQTAQAQGKANALPSKLLHQPSISITPLPRAPQPTPSAATGAAAGGSPAGKSGSFVICEICDGYIKDLEQLRNHMQWIHKVKIHPKMIYNRPPLNCQKCQFRFFTDQGLERHLLGSHGLVTSSMQEAANKGKDAGRCPVCGRVYQWKLLNHVARDHNLTLKPAHLSYKCTVCTATFGMYKQFENHVYSAHSVVAKRVIDKNKPQPGKAATGNDTLLKPMKINDEITIIPQPAKPALTATKAAVAKKGT